MSKSHELVMLYDGVCGFCNKSVQFVLDHDRRGTMRFAALQSDFGRALIARKPELEKVDSVVLLDSSSGAERVYVRSTAALRLSGYLGGFWGLARVAYIIPRPIRDFFYDQFARYRYKFFGKYDSCMLPPAEVRGRFLDMV
ncbi:MAG: DCC1-like thiol-disulfide oxidoreductase family protein [Pyrinomonadaceae bacterium]